MSPKHTPGPWTLSNTLGGKPSLIWHVMAETGPAVAIVAKVHMTQAEHDANARVIAAAPEMLQSLEGCLRALDLAMERAEGDCFGVGHNDAMDSMDAARALIKSLTA